MMKTLVRAISSQTDVCESQRFSPWGLMKTKREMFERALLIAASIYGPLSETTTPRFGEIPSDVRRRSVSGGVQRFFRLLTGSHPYDVGRRVLNVLPVAEETHCNECN